MRMTLSALIRSIAFLMVASTILAVGVSRAIPRASETARHAESAPRLFGINGAMFSPPCMGNYLLNAETGQIREFTPPGATSFEYVACAPWRDEHGEDVVAGRYTVRDDDSNLKDGSGLARIDLVTRKVLWKDEFDPIMTGFPSWLEGPNPRLIFAAGDGHLYLQEQASEDGPSPSRAGTSPVRVSDRNSGVADLAQSIIADPVRPIIAPLKGKLLVSLNPSVRKGDRYRLGNSQIWWIQLSESGKDIVSAGRVTRPSADGTTADERFPNVAMAPDGRLTLAFLRRDEGHGEWSLCLTPLAIDAKTGEPVADGSGRREIASDVCVMTPAFSPDGARIYPVERKFGPEQAVRQVAVTQVVGGQTP